MSEPYLSIACRCADIALSAAVPILQIYQQKPQAQFKADGSPVTEADLAADQIIREALEQYWPDVPVISEESFDNGNSNFDRFFLVDPLDGTREFLNRTGEFTVNIALIENGTPRMGVIFAPIHGSIFIGGEKSYRCDQLSAGDKLGTMPLEQMIVRDPNINHLIGLSSLSHGDLETDAFFQTVHPFEIRKSGSSLKFCTIANGNADFYPRFGPTMGWDIAAGDAILRAAGGKILDQHGELKRYPSQTLQNGPFLAIGNAILEEKLKTEFIRFCRNRHRA